MTSRSKPIDAPGAENPQRLFWGRKERDLEREPNGVAGVCVEELLGWPDVAEDEPPGDVPVAPFCELWPKLELDDDPVVSCPPFVRPRELCGFPWEPNFDLPNGEPGCWPEPGDFPNGEFVVEGVVPDPRSPGFANADPGTVEGNEFSGFCPSNSSETPLRPVELVCADPVFPKVPFC